MFKSRTSKKNSKAVVSELLENYLDVKDGKSNRKTASSASNASKINKIKVESAQTTFKRSEIKRKRTKERKSLNKRIVQKSREDEAILKITKLNDKDIETVNATLKERLAKLKDIDSLNDMELVDLQNEVFSLRQQSLNLDQIHESVLSNRERSERKLLNHLKRDDAIVGTTPGLAMPGESDDESDDDENDADGDQTGAADDLSNFKDDFDDYS